MSSDIDVLALPQIGEVLVSGGRLTTVLAWDRRGFRISILEGAGEVLQGPTLVSWAKLAESCPEALFRG